MVNRIYKPMYTPPDPERASALIRSARRPNNIQPADWDDIQAEATLLYLRRYRVWKVDNSSVPPTVGAALNFALQNFYEAQGKRRAREESLDHPDAVEPVGKDDLEDMRRSRETLDLVARAFHKRPAMHQHVLQTSPEGKAEVFLNFSADKFNRGKHMLHEGCARKAIPEQLALWATEPDPKLAITAKHAYEAFVETFRRLDR